MFFPQTDGITNIHHIRFFLFISFGSTRIAFLLIVLLSLLLSLLVLVLVVLLVSL